MFWSPFDNHFEIEWKLSGNHRIEWSNGLVACAFYTLGKPGRE